MFATPRKIITNFTLISSLLLSGLAQAKAIDTCWNFLKAQDYARAESEAQQLLKSGNLNRIDERYAQLCLGRAYQEMGRTQDALPIFQRVEALSQTTKELAVAYNFLGSIYTTLNDLDHAELYDQRALKAFRELGNKQSEARTLNNLAMVVKGRGDLVRALQLYREALAMMPEVEQAATLNNIALIHSQRKEYKQAITLLRQAIDIERRNANAHATAKWQINLGVILHNAKQYPAAEEELLAGLNAIRLVGDKSWEALACKELGWLANDDPKKSGDEVLQWFEKAEALYREIGDIESADSIATELGAK